MAQNEPTLQTMFFEDDRKRQADSLLAADGLSEVRSEFKKRLPKVAWGLVEKELQAKLEEILGVRVREILGAAWGKYTALTEYADPAKHPPEETAMVPLAQHSIRSAHSPHIDILIHEEPIGSLGVDVELGLELEGVVLKIRGGRILAAQAGSFQGDGSLECTFRRGEFAHQLLKLEKKTPKFTLDSAMVFENGIKIPAAPQADGSTSPDEA